MGKFKGTHARIRQAALIGGVTLCVGAMPAALTAGSASAQDATGGTVAHWGRGHLSPLTVHLPAPVVEVGTSNTTSYALLNNGALYAWGNGGSGQLGNGTTKNYTATPVKVKFPAGVMIASIPTDAMPWNAAFAIDTTGHVWGWGADKGGEMCQGNQQSSSTPVELLNFSHVTAVAGAAQHATYDAGGVLYSCGSNYDGQLGDGSTAASEVPVQVKKLSGASVIALVSGFGNTGALLSTGQYYDWGMDRAGQLGNGTVGKSSDVPVQVHLPAAATQAVLGGNATGDGQTLVMLSDGSVYAWGANSAGQLGTGATGSKRSPVQISPPAGVTYQTLATAGDSSYAVSNTGDVYAWGGNNGGQLGDGTTTASRTPVLVESQASQLISATSNNVAVSLQG
jgi:alpha-tubulin suppressor-like RCC1 family protein